MGKDENFNSIFGIEVRWGDMDAYGHVNNCFFFKYLESARFAYIEEIAYDGGVARNYDELPFVVVVDIDCKFEQQIHYPAQVSVKTRVTRLGNSSFDFYSEIWKGEQRAATSNATMVWLDAEKKRPCLMPAWFVSAVRAKENL